MEMAMRKIGRKLHLAQPSSNQVLKHNVYYNDIKLALLSSLILSQYFYFNSQNVDTNFRINQISKLEDIIVDLYLMLLFLLSLLTSTMALTEYYAVDSDFSPYPGPIPNELAHVRLVKDYFKDGWDKLYIYTSPTVSPLQQHQAAGFLQGYSTYLEIYSAYKNFAQLDFGGEPDAPEDIKNFLLDQLAYMDYMISTKAESDIFWIYVGYYLTQVRFMHAGYLARIKSEGKPEMALSFMQIYYLSSVGDLEDFIHFSPQQIDEGMHKNCNAYIRLDPNQLYTTQATHNRYSFLLRIYKFYNYPRSGVPMQWSALSSRPGDLISKDDFFLLGSGLRVLETSLDNNNPDNMKQVKYNTVPSWLRTLVANHLSNNGQDWIKYFLMSRSGTHNNQWVIIDPKQRQKESDLILFFQQAFSLYRKIDMTTSLKNQGYVASYNTPITEEVYKKLKYDPAKDPPYPDVLRGKILKEYHPKMTNIDQMKYWLINNEEEVPNRGLAPRYDLKEENPKPFGLTDLKIASENTIKNNYFWAYSGPSTSNGRFPPFSWNNWTDPKTPKQGLALTYDFQWVRIPIDLEKSEKIDKMLHDSR